MRFKETMSQTAVVLIVGGGLGAGAGYWAETASNEAAEQKIITLDTCKQAEPLGKLVTKSFVDCIETGVPGGEEITDSGLQKGDPAVYVDAIEKRLHIDEQFDYQRVGKWAAGVVVVGGVLTSL